MLKLQEHQAKLLKAKNQNLEELSARFLRGSHCSCSQLSH